jgi:hypothetical protein
MRVLYETSVIETDWYSMFLSLIFLSKIRDIITFHWPLGKGTWEAWPR